MPILTKEQQSALEHILINLHSKPFQILSGYAGTGKSFLISHIIKEIPNFAIAAYTGKAAEVLRKKGINTSQTIHSLIYVPQKDSNGNIKLDENNNPIFILSPNLDYEGIIIDEASMVGKEIYQDLLSFNKPIIFLGDGFQLPPIGDIDFNLMEKPDVKLETIHRNAGEIAYFAEFIRKGYRPSAWQHKGFSKNIKFINKNDIEKHMLEADQIICAFNKTRVEINKMYRNKLGLNSNFPCVGDRIICLRNDNKIGLFNGMQGTIEKLFEKPKNKMIFKTDDDKEFEILFDPSQFNAEKREISFEKDAPHPFDYAYCITCHKCQGSQFNKIMVIEQRCSLWDHKRWAYVAASRAETGIIWVE